MLSYSLVACVALFTSSAVALPINSTLAAIMEVVAPVNSTQTTSNSTWFYQNGQQGACGIVSADADLVAGLPLEFFKNNGTISPYCGTYIVVTSAINNLTVTARVSDASGVNSTLSLSVGSYEALNGTAVGVDVVSWRFANATETGDAQFAAKAAMIDQAWDLMGGSASTVVSSSVYTPPATTTPVYTPPAVTTPTYTTPAATTPAYTPPAATTPAYTPPASTTPAYTPPAATTPAYTPPAVSTPVYTPPAIKTPAYTPPAASTTPAYTPPAPAYTPPYTPPAPAYTPPAPSPKAAASSNSASYSGQATFFYQNGVAGACGKVNQDSAYVVAIDERMYNGGANCGRTVKITTSSGRSVTAVVADMCPTCASSGSLDLSVGAFDAIGSQSAGVLPITWSFA